MPDPINPVFGIGSPVTWIGVSNYTVGSDNSLTKGNVRGSNIFDADARSQETLTNGQYVSFRLKNYNGFINSVLGIVPVGDVGVPVYYNNGSSNVDTGTRYHENYNFYISGATADAVTSTSTQYLPCGQVVPNENNIFTIAIFNNQVRFFVNGVYLCTSALTPTLPQYFNPEMWNVGDKIDSVVIGTYSEDGGGGGGSTGTVTANAGPDQTDTVNSLVTLNGSASSASGTTIQSYAWTQQSGPASPALTGANTSQPTFTPTTPGLYIFQLTVTGTNGAASTDTVRITVSTTAGGGGAPLSAGPFTLTPDYPCEVETRKKVFVSQSDFGVRQTITKSRAFRFYKGNFTGRKTSEYDSLEAFWRAVYPANTFTWTNPSLNADGEFYFDSHLQKTNQLHNWIDYSVELRALAPITRIPQSSNVLPFTPSYGPETEQLMEVLTSDATDYSRKAKPLSLALPQHRLIFKSRYMTELLAIEAFWDYHYPARKISYTDPFTGATGLFWIDSDLKWRVLGVNLVEYSFAVRLA